MMGLRCSCQNHNPKKSDGTVIAKSQVRASSQSGLRKSMSMRQSKQIIRKMDPELKEFLLFVLAKQARHIFLI